MTTGLTASGGETIESVESVRKFAQEFIRLKTEQ